MFIEIGNHVINMDHVTDFSFTNMGRVIFYLDVRDGDSPASIILYDDEAQAFKETWDRMIVGLPVYKVC